MTLKYITSWLRKNSFSNLIPLLYVVPIIIIIMVNLINMFGDKINNYIYLKNSNYTYEYLVPEELVEDDKSQYMILLHKYSVSKRNEPLWSALNYRNSTAPVSLFVCSNEEALKNSAFTKKNIIQEKDEGITFGKLKNGTYPIYISINSAEMMRVGIGDRVYLEGIKNIYGFTIEGILRPYAYDMNLPNFKTGFVLADEEFISIIEKDFRDPEYNLFTNEQVPLDSSLATTKEDKLKKIARDAFVFENVYSLAAICLVMVILVLFEAGYLIKKNNNDINIFRLIGMQKSETNLIITTMSGFVFLVGILISLSFTKFYFLNLISELYIESFYLVVIGIAMFFIAILISFLLISIKNWRYYS